MKVRSIFALIVCSIFVFAITTNSLSAEKVTVSFFIEESSYRDAKPVIEQFMKENPDIKIESNPVGWMGMFEKLMTSLVAGTEDAVLNIHSSYIHRLAKLGFLEDLTPYISEIDVEDYWPNMIEHFRYNGKQYGIPFVTDVYGFVYNAEMYREAGLDPDRPPQNWEDLLSHLKKLTVPEKGQYGFGLFGKSGSVDVANVHNMFIRLNKGSVLDKTYSKCTLEEKSAIDAIRFVTDLYLKHKVCPPGMLDNDQNSTYDAFAMKALASCIISTGHVSQVLKANPDLDLRGAPIPKGLQWNGCRTYGAAFAISSKFPHKKEAWKFIKYLRGRGVYPRTRSLIFQVDLPCLNASS